MSCFFTNQYRSDHVTKINQSDGISQYKMQTKNVSYITEYINTNILKTVTQLILSMSAFDRQNVHQISALT
jgi:hypothetical protein